MKYYLLFVTIILAITFKITIAQVELACVGVQSGNFVKNSASCQHYFYCDGTRAHSALCPPNYFFQPRTQSCDHPYNVDCTQCSSIGVQHIEDPLRCNGYYRCINGTRTSVLCANELVFNMQYGDCRLPENANQICYNSICSAFTSYVRIGDPNDCGSFFNCLNGKPYKQTCAPGLQYNAHEGSCQIRGNFNFCQGQGDLIIPDESGTTQAVATTTTRSSATTTTATTRASTATATTISGATTATTRASTATATTRASTVTATTPALTTGAVAATTTTTAAGAAATTTTRRSSVSRASDILTDFKYYDCSDKENYVVFAHPTSCTQFIRCYNGQATDYNCYANLYWDDMLKQCTHVQPNDCY